VNRRLFLNLKRLLGRQSFLSLTCPQALKPLQPMGWA
jgi:hypothetical protein